MIGKSASSVTIGGIFCTGGDTRFGLICDAINMWLVIVPMGVLAAFVFKWPVMVVYFLLNLDEITKLPAIYIHYKNNEMFPTCKKEHSLKKENYLSEFVTTN